MKNGACPRIAYSQRVQVANNSLLECRVLVVIVQVLGKYMIIRYFDPFGGLSAGLDG